jgi:hypothetical protein
MVDHPGKQPEFSSLLDSERRMGDLRVKLNKILDFLIESDSIADRVQKVYRKQVSQLRSAIAVKIEAALGNELMEHEKIYLDTLVEGKSGFLGDIELIVDIEGSLKIRKEYMKKDVNSGKMILEEVKFRNNLLVAIDMFLENMTSMNFIEIATMVRGYHQVKETQKAYYLFDLDNCDLQLLPICRDFNKYFDKHLNSLISANSQDEDRTVNLSKSLFTDLNELQRRIYSVAENLK